ncbi:MAG: efflux RND transporter periplasmic adaptor subunit [Geminicoccaceae bacterium]
MSLGKQIGIVILILLAVAGGGYWYLAKPAGSSLADRSGKQEREPPTVEVAPATITKLARKVEAVGTTLARQAVDIRPATSGRIVEIAFAPASLVDAGSLLVRLDDAAERADVAEAEADRQKAELELERAVKLAAKKSIAQASVDQLEAVFRAAEARLLRAENALSDRSIKAPFSGQIGLKQVNIGAQVNESSVITTLDDLAEVDVDFSVPEVFFGTVRSGQPIVATSAAYGDRVFEGIIDTVDSRIDRVSRSFKVRARIPNSDLALPAGMFMAVEFELARREALTVPEEAITVDGDDIAVFVIKDDKAERRAVTLGQRNFGLVEVKDGLQEGDKVVVKGIQRVRAGAPVRISTEWNDAEGQKEIPSPAATTAAGA